jgi:peptidyl-prolyl cis-trans isomerase SurA
MPKDTLKAYMKAMGIRERILNGESFEKVARDASDDKSALMNNGNLGYFTVFQMIKPFEDAAYSIKPGTISMPVRTSFGYHIINVKDKRPSMGKIKVAHIMKAVPQGADEKVTREVESEINNIYDQLKNGSSFGALAAKYSDHKESAARNGELSWFGAGEIISDFSEAAFSISDTGEYTKPVRTIFGFHIIKLLDKKAPPSYEEARPMIESKIKASDINSLGKKSFLSKLKNEYNFKINPAVYDWFVKKTEYNLSRIPSGNIYSFANQYLDAKDFAKAIEKRNHIPGKDDPRHFIDTYIDLLASDQIIKYEDSILEKKYPEFRYLMNEFHDGILLFDISSKKVWDRIKEDSTGLYRYYEDHKNSYLSKRAIEGKAYTLNIPGGFKKLLSAYNRYSGKSETDRRLIEKFNRSGDTVLTISEHKWYFGDDPDIDNIEWSQGVHTINKNTIPTLIFVQKISEPDPLPYNDVQAEMITGYQDQLMAEWIEQLKKKYHVEIENSVFVEVKKLLNNE